MSLRQYKNGFVSVKRMFILKLPPFFPCRVGERKRAAISKQTCDSQKRVRSYIVLALVLLTKVSSMPESIESFLHIIKDFSNASEKHIP